MRKMRNAHSAIQSRPNKYYIPQPDDVPIAVGTLYKWYANLLKEISGNTYPEWGWLLLGDKRNYYGKYLWPQSRAFFLNHFAKNLAATLNFVCNAPDSRPRILEIGSWCGNQLLLLAFLGAEVYGCDIRADVCDLVKRRQKFYEDISGRRLNIER